MTKDLTIPELPRFQYDTPTVAVDDLVLDAEALNAYIRRAESAYNRANVKYCIGQDCPDKGKGKADLEADTGAELYLDCSGFAWWATYRRGIWAHAPGKDPKGSENWVVISQPLPGTTVRYGAAPGRSYGHSGVIIAPGPDGNFQTLDSTNEGPPKASEGSIVYRPDGRKKWLAPNRPNPQFLVSSEAIISKGGQPYPRKQNLLLAAAKHPIATLSLATVALIGLGYYLYRRQTA